LRITRANLKLLARSRVDILLAKSIETAKEDLNLAKRQARLSRQICLKYNLRLLYGEKQLFCRKCKKFIVPGVTSRVRIGHSPKAIRITCLECGHTYRKLYKNKNKKSK
jgi:ribonuclease P protein subunit RPR2